MAMRSLLLFLALRMHGVHGAATLPSAATQARIVELHNILRCGMCDTPPLAWDAAIAQNALDYMNTGAADGHCPSTTGAVPGCVGNGENMYSGVAADDAFEWELAVNLWFQKEIDCYNFDTGANTCVAGHMTQVAWDTSTRIGCASNDGATGAMKSLCMYQAPGNFNGQANYVNHVKKCPVARQYEYYTGAASCCNGPPTVCKNGNCGWEYAKETTTRGCPAGSCSVHASCTAAAPAPSASPPASSPPASPSTSSAAPPTTAPAANTAPPSSPSSPAATPAPNPPAASSSSPAAAGASPSPAGSSTAPASASAPASSPTAAPAAASSPAGTPPAAAPTPSPAVSNAGPGAPAAGTAVGSGDAAAPTNAAAPAAAPTSQAPASTTPAPTSAPTSTRAQTIQINSAAGCGISVGVGLLMWGAWSF